MKLAPPFGIDLGTTRSAAAIYLPQEGIPRVAPDAQGRLTMPSAAQPLDDGRWLVGDDALKKTDLPHRPLRSVKRKIGRTAILRPDLPSTTAEDVSAIILASLKARLATYLPGAYPTRYDIVPGPAVITVPAYFDAPQIEATRQAGEMAGLQVAGLIQEPTAAAIYHTWKHNLGDGVYLVYDLGGGTFDVSLIRSLGGEYQVLAIDGDNHLGGDDFDRRLADLLRRQLVDQGFDLGIDFSDELDRENFELLTDIARQLKEEFSTEHHLQRSYPALFFDHQHRQVDLQIDLERAQFEATIRDLVDQTIKACWRAIHRAEESQNLRPDEIQGVFLVGGSSRVPIIRQVLAEDLIDPLNIPYKRVFDDEPETSVALGAALCAAATSPLIESFPSDPPLTLKITSIPDATDPVLSAHLHLEDPRQPHQIQLRSPDDDADIIAETQLTETEDGFFFSFYDLDFESLRDEHHELHLRLFDRHLTPLADFPAYLPLRPADATPPPAMMLTNPAVLAKDINLETVTFGQARELTILPHGSHLPASATARLVTADASGALVLRLFQHKLPIHTLVLPLPEHIGPGAPVTLTLHVDQAMNITASGSVAGQTFWARVTPPNFPRERRWDEIEALLESLDRIETQLWGGEARRFLAQAQDFRAGIHSALRTDPDRLQVLANRLSAFLEDYGDKDARSPALPRVLSLLDTCRRLVFSSPEGRLNIDHKDWTRRFTDLEHDVKDAWEDTDDQRWREVADRVQATFESLAQDEYHFLRADPQTYASNLFTSIHERIHQLRSDLDEFPYSDDPENRALQESALRPLHDGLAHITSILATLEACPEDLNDLERLSRRLTTMQKQLRRSYTIGVPRASESKR